MDLREHILFVANLQVYSVPYATLYVDMKRKTLVLFVRVSAPNQQEMTYITTDITKQQLEEYLDKKIGLLDLYTSSSYQLVKIHGTRMDVVTKPHQTFHLTAEFTASNIFDPEYFYDKLRVISFIKKMNNNQVFA
jgi:hypothetical protein